MRADRTRLARAGKAGGAGVGVAVLAVVCCGAVPLLVALASTVALGAILGVGAGILALAALAAAVTVQLRRRHACRTDAAAPRRGTAGPR